MNLRFIRATTSLALVILISACGGSDDGGDNPIVKPAATAQSTSFSPSKAADDKGKDVPLYWAYRVNNGQSFSVNYAGVNMNMRMGDLKILIDPASFRRRIELTGSVNGTFQGITFSGTVSMKSNEQLDPDAYPNSTLIETEKLNVVIAASGGGENINFSLKTDLDFSPAAEWFPDRHNLDLIQYPIGYTKSANTGYDGTFTINITPADLGFNSFNTPVSGSSPESWRIADKFGSITVNGQAYDNIVKIVRTVQTPDPATGSPMASNITYWVAKGIGVVKSENQFNVLGRPLTTELIDTNLVVTPAP